MDNLQVQNTDQLPGQIPTQQPSNMAVDNWPKIQNALREGYTRDEITGYMSQELGINSDEAHSQVIGSMRDKINSALEEGYNYEEIKEFMIQQNYHSSVINDSMKLIELSDVRKKWKFDAEQNKQLVGEAMDISDLYRNVYSKYSTGAKQVGGFFNDRLAKEAQTEVMQLNNAIVTKLNEQGFNAFVNPTNGEVMVRNERGMELEVDSSILNDLYNQKFEIGGAITGAIAGSQVGAATGRAVGAGVGVVAGNLTGVGLATPEEPATALVGAMVGDVIGRGVGMVAGGMAGAGIGRGLDVTRNSMLLKEQIETQLLLTQMKEAAIFDGVAGIIGAGVFKMGKSGLSGMMKAYDFVLDGNRQGAYKALLDNMLITDDQAKEIVQQWEKQTGQIAPGKTMEDKALAVVTTTQQGTEGFVDYVARQDPKVATQIIKDIDIRAKDVIKLAEEVSDENVGTLIRTDLQKYVGDVKQYYNEVRQIGSDAIDGTDFVFDFDKLALDPIVKSITKDLGDPTYQNQYLRFINKVQDASTDRSFTSLIELRQATNDFKYSKTKLKKPDYDALNSVINKIDGQIQKAVKDYMPDNGKVWLDNFAKAKDQYAKMKKLEENVLFRTLTRKGITEDTIKKSFKKYIDSLDGTFTEVLEKLPTKTRAKAEGAVVEQYIDRYTLGYATDNQALHFPMISESLKSIDIKTPEAKYVKEVIDDMAVVFRNDPNLSKVSGNIAVPKFQSYLTADPVVRLKFEVASQGFNFIKRKVPGRQANNLALLKNLENVLENPLQKSNVDSLISKIPNESKAEMTSLVKQLQVEFSKNPPVQRDFVKMYKQNAQGKLAVTDGALGKGLYLVDNVKNPNPSSKIVSQEVNMSRMASIEDISSILGREVTSKEIRTIPNIQETLLDKGYLGIRMDNKVMLFPDSIIKGKTIPKTISNQ